MLDAQIQALIEQVTSSPRVSLLDLPLEDMRRGYCERYLSRGLDDIVTTKSEVVEIECDGRVIMARLYHPKSQSETAELPLIIYFHGGGFVLGDVDSYDHQSKHMAELTGARVLTVDYRRAPEDKFPAAIDDGIASVLWAFESNCLNIDKERITVAGDSAGGSMAISAAIAAAESGRVLRHLLLLYPVVDWRPSYGSHNYESINLYGKGFFLDKVLLDWFAQQYFLKDTDCLDDRASPILSTQLNYLPDTTVVTAGKDPLCDMGEAFSTLLTKAGVNCQYLKFDSLIHNFIAYSRVSECASTAFIKICEELRVALEIKNPSIQHKTQSK